MSGLLLAFDTATDECALALGQDHGERIDVIAQADFTAPRAALGRLLPAAEELLARHSHTVRHLSGIVVGLGPGSFTGVRIGVSTAKGLGHGLGVPLFGVGTLDAVAMRFAGQSGVVGIVGDAMRGEVYPRAYRLAGGTVEPLGQVVVARPMEAAAEWASTFAGEDMLLAGNGLAKHADAFTDALGKRARIAEAELWKPTGAGLLAAFEVARAAGTPGSGDPSTLLPIYTRLSDAEETERERAGIPSGRPPASGVAGEGE